MSVALRRSIFGEQGDQHELAALIVPSEGTGDAQTDQIIASANVGELFWYTLPQMHLEMDTLEAAYATAGIDRRYLPGKIQASDAFRRASSALEQSAEAEMSGKTVRANLMVRDVGNDKNCSIRQAVVEVRDAANVRLLYTPAGQFELRKADGQAIAMEMDGQGSASALEASTRRGWPPWSGPWFGAPAGPGKPPWDSRSEQDRTWARYSCASASGRLCQPPGDVPRKGGEPSGPCVGKR